MIKNFIPLLIWMIAIATLFSFDEYVRTISEKEMTEDESKGALIFYFLGCTVWLIIGICSSQS